MKILLFDVCLKCQNRLTKEEIDGSDGFCPKCGYDSGSLTCKVEKKKFISLHTWWKFWKKKHFVPIENIDESLKPIKETSVQSNKKSRTDKVHISSKK